MIPICLEMFCNSLFIHKITDRTGRNKFFVVSLNKVCVCDWLYSLSSVLKVTKLVSKVDTEKFGQMAIWNVYNCMVKLINATGKDKYLIKI